MSRFGRIRNGRFLPFLFLLLLLVPAAHPAFAVRLAFQRSMMGTSIEMVVCGAGREVSEKAVEKAYGEVKRIETKLSVYRKETKLSEINRAAGARRVEVDEEMYRLIEASKRFSLLSGGAFDITVQCLADLWDFGGPGFHVPLPSRVESRLDRVDYRKIRLRAKDSTVFLEKEGMAISLGGIAKGYAVDRAVAILRKSGIPGGIVSAGGDLFAYGRKENGDVWQVGVRNPRAHDRNIGVLPVSNMAVATSGDYERYRVFDGKRYHHIIDPRTGYPSEGCMSVTVVTDRTMTADALATAVFVLGPQEGMALLERLPQVEGIIVDQGGKITTSTGLGVLAEGFADGNPDRLDPHQRHNGRGSE